MSENAQRHYFIAERDAPPAERTWTADILGHRFAFTVCNGLFSYEKPDAASVLLLEVMHSTLVSAQGCFFLEGGVLDLGCGYGLIGTVLAKTGNSAGPMALTLSDVNETACKYAAANLKTNGVAARVVCSDGFADITERFAYITLNPPIHAGKDVTYRLYKEASAHLTPQGALYIVIQKKHGAESTLVFLTSIYKQVKILYKRKGYYIVRCRV